MSNRIAIRVEGSNEIGTGHVARCMTLAEELSKKAVDPIFCLKDVNGFLADEISKKGFRVEQIPISANSREDAECFTLVFKKYDCQAAVLDGYDFDQEYLENIRNEISFILSIDDIAQTFFCSDVVLNQNINATVGMYEGKVSPQGKLLLGSAYVLLREEFQKWKGVDRNFTQVKNILVTFGGADPHNLTLRAVKALERIPGDFYITVVLGLGNPNKQQIRDYIDSIQRNICVLENVSNMGELMAEADIAISSGGSTTWELCCLGVPTLQVVLAKNQMETVIEVDRRGAVINLGWYQDVTEREIQQKVAGLMADSGKRQMMSGCGKLLIDGQGAQRVASEILTHCREKSLL